MAAIFTHFVYSVFKSSHLVYKCLHFLTEGVQKSAKATSQVRKPPGHAKVER